MKLPLTLTHVLIASESRRRVMAISIRSSDDRRTLSLFAEGFANTDSEQLNRNINTRIIGGSKSQQGRFSYTVSLQDDIGHFCGGTLIARDVVLTAAHCQGGNYDVVINRQDLSSSSGEVISMAREVPHPKYDDFTTDYDFNLVFLSRPTIEEVTLLKINSDENSPSIGQEVFVMGWGDITSDDSTQELSNSLMDVSLNVISNEQCEQSSGMIWGWHETYNNQISDVMLCAKDHGEDACQGDSGGPLVIPGIDLSGADDRQVGVVSWGTGCANKSFPGVYARVSSVYQWIKDEVCNHSTDPPSHLCESSKESAAFTQFVLSPSSPPQSEGVDGNWRTILVEDFDAGYGVFIRGGAHARRYESAASRVGVIRIQDGKGFRSSFYSSSIELTDESEFRVSFSFYTISMEDDDSFCLDYSINSSDVWVTTKCWSTGNNDFSNRIWIDDVSVEFAEQNASDIRIRFVCQGNSKKDDVLFDKVEMWAK